MDKAKLREYLAGHVMKGEFILSSGKVSNVYIDGRQVTLSSRGLVLVCEQIVELMLSKGIFAIAGLSIGADPIIAGVLTVLGMRGYSDVHGLIVRKKAKEHGRKRQIEGPVEKVVGKEVLVVDDVATTGGSIILATKVLREAGIKASLAAVVVDREEGASDNLRKEGIELSSLFKISDLI